MRGTRFVPLGFRGGCGIIPAYAGNTLVFDADRLERRDHPRVCGEHELGHGENIGL